MQVACQFAMMKVPSPMKKFFAFLATILFFCIPLGFAHAAVPTVTPTPAVDPFRIADCLPEEGDPTALNICHVRYDVVNSVIKLDQVDTTFAQHSMVGLGKIANMIWNGIVKPSKNNYAIGTTRSKQYGDQAQDASFLDLTPAGLQDITIHDTSPKTYSVTSRLCVADPTTGKLAGDFITDEVWFTAQDVPGLNPLTEGNQRLAAIASRYTQTSQNFTKPDLIVKKIIPPGCSQQSSGDPIPQSIVSSVAQNLYGKFSDAKTSIPYTIDASMQTETTRTDSNGNEIPGFVAKFPVQAKHEAGGLLPWEGHNLALGAGLTSPSDLDPITYIDSSQKKVLEESGGWINNMYRNDGYDPAYTVGLNATFLDQPFEVSLLRKDTTADTTIYALRRVDEAQTFANCNLTTDAEQKLSRNQDINCNKSWVAPLSAENIAATPPSPENSRGAVTGSVSPIKPDAVPANAPANYNGAAAKMVPACVLNAVATIEGAFEGGTSCKPDECGAVGPFQVSIGQCTNACHASSCPASELPKNVSRTDACGWDVGANVAASVLIGKAKYFGYNLTNASPATQKWAIIFAADAYNGTTHTISRLTSSTGKPLTYGEWVYAHCDPSYTSHTDHSFPKQGGATLF